MPPWVPLLLCGVVIAALWAVLNYWTPTPQSAKPKSATVGTKGAAPNSRDRSGQDLQLSQRISRANELLQQDKVNEALALLTEALALKPDDEDIHYNLGIAYSRQGDNAQAMAHYEEALRLFPEYTEALNNLGNLYLRLGKTEEAIQRFQLALKILPDHASAWNNLGNALAKGGRLDEAIVDFRKAVELKPDYWQAHFNLGSALANKQNLTEAKACYQTVLQLQPGFKPAQDALQKLAEAPAPLGPVER